MKKAGSHFTLPAAALLAISITSTSIAAQGMSATQADSGEAVRRFRRPAQSGIQSKPDRDRKELALQQRLPTLDAKYVYAKVEQPRINLKEEPGLNKTWDFSHLASDKTLTREFVSVGKMSNLPPAGGANFVMLDTGKNSVDIAEPETFIVKYTEEGTYWLAATDAKDYWLIYNDTKKMMEFPCTYKTQFVDPFKAVVKTNAEGKILLIREGTSEVSGIAQGTLKLPSGIFKDVILMKSLMVYDDTDAVTGEKHHYRHTHYMWVSADYPVPLVDYEIVLDNGKPYPGYPYFSFLKNK